MGIRVPASLEPLLDQGVIDEVIRPLQSGKEAEVYLVWSREEVRVAKVYKEAKHRSFQHRSSYTEGRKVRNTRQQRAMDKRSKYGRDEAEAEWRHAEVDAIYRLKAANVRVPEPYDYVDNVLIMELVRGPDGEPAGRLVDETFTAADARRIFDVVVQEVVKMLCAGIVHGDLSDFNILMSDRGPVIIDFPQWVDAAENRNASKILIRDVDNLQMFLGRYVPGLRERRFGREMWDLYERNELRPDTVLTGEARARKQPKNDPYALLREIEELEAEGRARRERLGLPIRPARRPAQMVAVPEKKPQPNAGGRPQNTDGGKGGGKSKRGRGRGRSDTRQSPSSQRPAGVEVGDADLDDLDALLLIGD